MQNLDNNVLVTIYMPTFNRLSLLQRAVESLQKQTYKNIEIIIVDDCSTDGTKEYLQQLSQQDDRVHYVLKEKNSGACASRNIAIEMAQGEFITGLDDDDYFQSDRIESFINFYKKTGYDFLCTSFLIKNKNNILKSNGYDGEIDAIGIRNKNLIDSQVFTRLKYFKQVGGFDINAPAWQDYDLWFRLVTQIKPCYRINNYSYVKDVSHEAGRITTSSKAHQGYQHFINKHENILSDSNKKCLYMVDILNRNQKIKFIDLMKNFCMNSLIIFIKHKFPKKLLNVIRR